MVHCTLLNLVFFPPRQDCWSCSNMPLTCLSVRLSLATHLSTSDHSLCLPNILISHIITTPHSLIIKHSSAGVFQHSLKPHFLKMTPYSVTSRDVVQALLYTYYTECLSWLLYLWENWVHKYNALNYYCTIMYTLTFWYFWTLSSYLFVFGKINLTTF